MAHVHMYHNQFQHNYFDVENTQYKWISKSWYCSDDALAYHLEDLMMVMIAIREKRKKTVSKIDKYK